VSDEPRERKPSPWWIAIVGAALVALCALIVWRLVGARRHHLRSERASREAEVGAGPRVLVMVAKRAPAERHLTLQAEARPFASVTLYAKVSGYLREVRVDKGDRVREGQVLAVIESPEIDKQYQAAVADAKNKRDLATRARALAPSGVVSAQAAESAESAAEIAEANVRTLGVQRDYEVLRAPFAGTVTARYADPGALVQNATGSQTSALPVVDVAQTARLRVFVYLDQRDAPFVHPGDAAILRVPERAGLELPAKVARVSGQLDPRSRMMLGEIDYDNAKGEVFPGSFIQARLTIRAPSLVELPTEALVLRGQKPFVAIVGPDDRVAYRPVEVADDDGERVRITSGVREGDRVALALGDNVVEGARVQPFAAGAPPNPPRGTPTGIKSTDK